MNTTRTLLHPMIPTSTSHSRRSRVDSSHEIKPPERYLISISNTVAATYREKIKKNAKKKYKKENRKKKRKKLYI